jgi:hypothetical protein
MTSFKRWPDKPSCEALHLTQNDPEDFDISRPRVHL